MTRRAKAERQRPRIGARSRARGCDLARSRARADAPSRRRAPERRAPSTLDRVRPFTERTPTPFQRLWRAKMNGAKAQAGAGRRAPSTTCAPAARSPSPPSSTSRCPVGASSRRRGGRETVGGRGREGGRGVRRRGRGGGRGERAVAAGRGKEEERGRERERERERRWELCLRRLCVCVFGHAGCTLAVRFRITIYVRFVSSAGEAAPGNSARGRRGFRTRR